MLKSTQNVFFQRNSPSLGYSLINYIYENCQSLFHVTFRVLFLFSCFKISQQLDVISRLERDLSESSRDLENLNEKASEDVSGKEGEPFLNNNTYFQD